MNKKLLIGVLAIIIVGIAVLASSYLKPGTDGGNGTAAVVPVTEDPVETLREFVNQWIDVRNDPNTNPYEEQLASYEHLTDEMRQTIATAEDDFFAQNYDPVLCTTTIPTKLRTRATARSDAWAEITILNRNETSRPIAFAQLVGVDGVWKINRIDCNTAETAPRQGEYSFERTGYLLKHSVQPPLDPSNWYLVYESNGTMGYTAMLHFDESSVCKKSDESTIACNDDGLVETMHVQVRGDMTEAGVSVVSVEEL